MEKKRILLAGLEPAETDVIRAQTDALFVVYETLPCMRLSEGVLYAESRHTPGKFLPIDAVVYHGIFENDFDFITLLALWSGPCLPDALGMMDCRLRHQGLVHALRVSRFGSARRGMSIRPEEWQTETELVAKWGNWHCGENKQRFTGVFQTTEPTVFEPFIKGEAVRIMLVGDEHWQIRLAGEGWLRSIHHPEAGLMKTDPDLLADARALAQRFNLITVGIDYMIAEDGSKHLLEVNHIPNVTVFPFVREAWLKFAVNWIATV